MKVKRWHKSAPVFFPIALENIDAENGIIRNVVLVQSGKNKYGDILDTVFLEQLVAQAEQYAQGVKSRFGHPNMCDTTLGSFIGRFKNHRVGTTTRTDNGVAAEVPAAIADLHLDTVAKQTPKGNLYDYVLNMAQKNPDMFGNSIVFMPDESEMVTEEDANGKKHQVPHMRMREYIASDLVDSPAATNNLFNETTDFAAVVTEFLDEHPEIYQTISANEDILTDFLKKYAVYKTDKNMKNPKSKSLGEKAKGFFKTLLGFDTTMIDTADGKTISVDCANGSEPAVGDPVKDDAGAPMPNADIKLKDGRTLITDPTGNISAIKPAEGSDASSPVENAPAANEVVPPVDTLESLQLERTEWQARETELTRERDEAATELEELQASYEETNRRLEHVAKNQTTKVTLESGKTTFGHSPATAQLSKEERKAKIKGEKAPAPAAAV